MTANKDITIADLVYRVVDEGQDERTRYVVIGNVQPDNPMDEIREFSFALDGVHCRSTSVGMVPSHDDRRRIEYEAI